jgi:hypothetical protein
LNSSFSCASLYVSSVQGVKTAKAAKEGVKEVTAKVGELYLEDGDEAATAPAVPAEAKEPGSGRAAGAKAAAKEPVWSKESDYFDA